jgi:DNA-binding XRE family transcriptional regulator
VTTNNDYFKDKIFVRSQDQISILKSGAKSTVTFTYDELVNTFENSEKILDDICDYGSSVMISSHEEPMRTIKETRSKLGFSHEKLAEVANVTLQEILDLENTSKRNPMSVYIKVCPILGLNYKTIGFK